jgi:hypothetical protein
MFWGLLLSLPSAGLTALILREEAGLIRTVWASCAGLAVGFVICVTSGTLLGVRPSIDFSGSYLVVGPPTLGHPAIDLFGAIGTMLGIFAAALAANRNPRRKKQPGDLRGR